MKKITPFSFILFLALWSCSSDELKDHNSRMKLAILDLDNYYRSDAAWNSTYDQIKNEVAEISKKHSVKLIPLSYEEFRSSFQPIFSQGAKVECVCCGPGGPTSVEIVDEGGGCFGIVRHYANGSASISSYCDNGATYNGYECYE